MAHSIPLGRGSPMPAPLIIGGGPAGAVAACWLARAGYSATVLERTSGATDKVCGDFLSGEALGMLESLGISPRALGARPISRVRLIRGRSMVEAELPFPAAGLSRRILDEALLQRATQAGARVVRGHTVQSIVPTGAGFSVRAEGLSPIAATTVFLATGKHNLRGVTRGVRSDRWVGLKVYVRLSPGQRAALGGAVELALLSDGYAGLQLVEGDRAVLCVLTKGRVAPGLTNWWDEVTQVNPHLRVRLEGAVPLMDRPLAIAGMPYGFLYRPSDREIPGLFRLGDQAGVIASLTGDGVAIAMLSGFWAARAWRDGRGHSGYHADIHLRLRPRVRVASALQSLLTTTIAQPALMLATQAFPGLMRFSATLTRVARTDRDLAGLGNGLTPDIMPPSSLALAKARDASRET